MFSHLWSMKCYEVQLTVYKYVCKVLMLHEEKNQCLKRRLYPRLKLRFLSVVQNDENRRLKPRYVASDETTTIVF